MGITSDEPSGGEHRGSRSKNAQSANLSPSSQLAAMTRDRVDALERDKRLLQTHVGRLQAEVDRLGPENARLQAALGQAESFSVLASLLIGVGGFLVSYATFTGKSADRWANVSAGLLLAGVSLMVWQSSQRWQRR